MAAHQTGALRILNAVSENGVSALATIGSLSGFYPPLYHSIVAGFYRIFGVSSNSAQLANIPALAILMASTYFIGRRLVSPLVGATAATLVGFYPFILWISRETLIDYWLTSLVALAFWILLESEGFGRRRLTVLFGLVCGLGMLTKWTFALFLFLPALWFARHRWREASLAAVVAFLVASYWYVPQFDVLSDFLALNTAGGIAEGDPARASWQAIVFYVRALEGYQLFLPLFGLFVAGSVWLARNFKPDWVPVILWILGGWLGLMMFQNKDPRYSVAILPAVALISASIFESRKAWLGVLLPFLMFQHYLVSFGIQALPEKVVVASGVQGPISWDWNLYTQSHFDLWGRPQKAGLEDPVCLGPRPGIFIRSSGSPRVDSRHPEIRLSGFRVLCARSKGSGTGSEVDASGSGGYAKQRFLVAVGRSRGISRIVFAGRNRGQPAGAGQSGAVRGSRMVPAAQR